ncbi:MAG: MFS transporter [Desulfovibrionaceae bacterium]
MSISSLEKLYFNSLISSYEVVGNDLRTNILSALRFGKSLEKFVGIHDLLAEVKSNIPDLHNVNVVDLGGRILYSLDETLVGTSWRELTRNAKKQKKGVSDDGISTITADGIVYNILTLKGRDGKWLGSIALSFKEDVINQKVRAVIYENLTYLGLSLAGAALLLGCLLFWLFKPGAPFDQQKRRLYIVIVAVLVAAQLAYSACNVRQFQNRYVEMSRANAVTLSKLLKDDIEYLFSKGLSINRLFKIDVLLSNIVKTTSEIDSMSILDARNVVRYKADQQGVVKFKKDDPEVEDSMRDDYYDIIVPLYKMPKDLDVASATAAEIEAAKTLEGYIKINLSETVIGARVKEILYDSGTVVLISFLFVIELLILLLLFLQRDMTKEDEQTAEQQQAADWGMMRPVIFIYLLAMSLSQSFIPLQMKALYLQQVKSLSTPLWGMTKDVVLGLPISVEMLAAGLSLIPVGIWMDKRGWHEPFFSGVLLSIAGAAFSGFANSPLLFVAARAITGVGYGFTWIAAQGFIFSYTDRNTRARGLSNLVAGIFAGQICGASVGGMLSERMGFTPVFFVGMSIASMLLVISVLFLRSYCRRPAMGKSTDSISLRQVFQYAFDRRIFSVLWLSVVPMSMCIVGILFYLSPIYMKSLGKTQSDIGRALMIFGFCAIYLAPILSKFVDKSPRKKPFIFLSGVIGGLGLLVFQYYDGLPAMIFAICMLGLASSVGVAAQTVFALNAPAAQRIGTGKALSIQRTVDKIGQMLGPIIVGTMIAAVDIQMGLAFVGIIYMLCSFVFLLAAGPEQTG